jgi:hypothetical protein
MPTRSFVAGNPFSSCRDLPHVVARRVPGRGGPQTSDDVQIVAVAGGDLLRTERDRYLEIGARVWKMKSGRHDADDRVRLAAHADRPADQEVSALKRRRRRRSLRTTTR